MIGQQAGSGQTTASNNTFVGAFSGEATTDGNSNVAVGKGALKANTTGSYNVAIGYDASLVSTDATQNVVIGYDAGKTITSGGSNVINGFEAAMLGTTLSACVVIGHRAAKAITTADSNTIVGYNAALGITTGSSNTIIGTNAGELGTRLTTGARNTLVGHKPHTSAADSVDQIVMGFNAVGAANSSLTFGNAGTDSSIVFGQTSISAPSDIRLKENIEDSTAGLSFINDLRPVTFMWKAEQDIPENLDAHVAGSTQRYNNDNVNHGFIAQEVKSVIDNHPEIKNGFKMWYENESDGRQRIADGAMIPMLVKSIQELSAEIEILKAK
jgi:hypothetical protein